MGAMTSITFYSIANHRFIKGNKSIFDIKLKKMDNTSDTKKIVAAALIGVAAGALLGVLFAPNKGSETRKKIKEKGGEMADAFKDKISTLSKDMQENFAGDSNDQKA